MEATVGAPAISVIIPARNCADQLSDCLRALLGSEFRDFEVIVVDDASEDDTAARAEGAGARTLRLERQRGPAVARNRGTEIASADILCFLDADVLAHPDTLSSIASELAEDPSLDALFGSYDTHPTARNPVSQYRNLLHHFTHQHAREEATTFWAGCGAIRRLAFFAIGGFSQDFDRPCIEGRCRSHRLRHANRDHRRRVHADQRGHRRSQHRGAGEGAPADGDAGRAR